MPSRVTSWGSLRRLRQWGEGRGGSALRSLLHLALLRLHGRPASRARTHHEEAICLELHGDARAPSRQSGCLRSICFSCVFAPLSSSWPDTTCTAHVQQRPSPPQSPGPPESKRSASGSFSLAPRATPLLTYGSHG